MSFFIDHRPKLKLYLQGVIENLKYLNSLSVVSLKNCKRCIYEIRELRKEIQKIDNEWIDALFRKKKK